MSISHKAWLFDYNAFADELAGTLDLALVSGSGEVLERFIARNLASLANPETEEALEPDWRDGVDLDDVQALADIALTRYYDLTDEQGFGGTFDALYVYLRSVPTLGECAELLIGGELVGPAGNRLDPGLMGTGMLSAPFVAEFHKLLERTEWPPIPDAEFYAACDHPPGSVEEVQAALDQLLELFRRAREAQRGLLFTDFSEGGVGSL